jgi:hypothetical protein
MIHFRNQGAAGRPLGSMQRIDGHYLYRLGYQLHPLGSITKDMTYDDVYYSLLIAEGALEPLLHNSVFKLRTSYRVGTQLLTAIKAVRESITGEKIMETMEHHDLYVLGNGLKEFEAVLAAELAVSPLYLVTQKAGFDTALLIEFGAVCFPTDLHGKAPEAIPDVEQGTRCLAFELPTAAAFHLHRANESVLHRYWDAVTKGAVRPTTRNMGDYLKEMNAKKVGDPKVKSALKDLKDLHRNPLIHPEHTLETLDEAIALMNGIHTVMVYMLREMPVIEEAEEALQAGAAATTLSPS